MTLTWDVFTEEPAIFPLLALVFMGVKKINLKFILKAVRNKVIYHIKRS